MKSLNLKASEAKMDKRFFYQSVYHSVLKILMFLLVVRAVSCQNEPILGVFSVSFNVVLSNQDELPTTVATTTTTVATTAVDTTIVPSTTQQATTIVDSTTQLPADETTSTAVATVTDGPSSFAVNAALVDSSTEQPLVASTTTIAVTSVPDIYTQPPSVTDEIGSDIYDMLTQAFLETTAYQSVTKPLLIDNDGTMLTYNYGVIYDKSKLNEELLLHEDSAFIQELRNVTELISSIKHNFTAEFNIHERLTKETMTSTIDTLNQQFGEEAWLCTGSQCASNTSTCHLNDNGTVSCVGKCEVLEAESKCTADPSVYGVYLEGTCKLDSSGNPYCDCGKSPGDIMSNFYDGERCVSVTFIVAMAASAGGLFFILWLITLCILVCGKRRSKGNGSSRKSSSTDFSPTYNGYHEAYHNNMELDHRPYDKNYGSHGSPLSSHTNNAYEVTKESDEEFKSIRL